jgi:protein phosphatase
MDQPTRTIPPGRSLRIVGDVHGDAKAFAHAAATGHFLVQLGDLIDDGPDSPGVLRQMFGLIDQGNGLFILGNHDYKLGRALAGSTVRHTDALDTTLAGLDEALAARALAEIKRAPSWLRWRDCLFVHGGFQTEMLTTDSPAGIPRQGGPASRALYGLPTGRTQPDGYPERSLAWIDRIPPGLTVYCGHDRRSTDGRPWVRRNALGGTAIFMDTGAGKGGHLSWVDLPAG